MCGCVFVVLCLTFFSLDYPRFHMNLQVDLLYLKYFFQFTLSAVLPRGLNTILNIPVLKRVKYWFAQSSAHVNNPNNATFPVSLPINSKNCPVM